MDWKKLGKRVVVGGVAALLLAQLVPYGRDHTNPAVVKEAPWNSPEARALAKRACYDCHSNETKWPWYSHVAPMSWLVYHDTVDGRKHINFSTWNDEGMPGSDEGPDQVRSGDMPFPPYKIMHPEARLTDAERQVLIKALEALPEPGEEEAPAAK